jgi:hypothetical protein
MNHGIDLSVLILDTRWGCENSFKLPSLCPQVKELWYPSEGSLSDPTDEQYAVREVSALTDNQTRSPGPPDRGPFTAFTDLL